MLPAFSTYLDCSTAVASCSRQFRLQTCAQAPGPSFSQHPGRPTPAQEGKGYSYLVLNSSLVDSRWIWFLSEQSGLRSLRHCAPSFRCCSPSTPFNYAIHREFPHSHLYAGCFLFAIIVYQAKAWPDIETYTRISGNPSHPCTTVRTISVALKMY